MGLFSSKKKIVVNTTVQPIMDEGNLPNSVRTGVLTYMLEDWKMVPSVINEFQNNIGIKSSLGYGWAKRAGYHYGLPTSSVFAQDQARTKVEDLLKALYGATTSMTHYTMGPLNSAFYAWQTSVMGQGYNPTTNEMTTLSSAKGTPVYLADILTRYTQDTVNFLSDIESLDDLAPLGTLANAGPRPSQPSGNPAAKATPYSVDTAAGAFTNTAQVVYEYLGTPSMVKSLLHMEGAPLSASFTDDTGIVWSAPHDVLNQTDVFKFGSSSAWFTPPGVLFSQANDAFKLTADFTVDCHVRLSTAAAHGIWMVGTSTVDTQRIQVSVGADMSVSFQAQASSSSLVWDITSAPNAVALNQMTHIAATRYGNWVVLHVNGKEVARGKTVGTPTTSRIMRLGVARVAGSPVNLEGYIDEFRVTHASRWIGPFTAPTAAATLAEVPIIQGHLDVTIPPSTEDLDFHQARAIKPDGVPTYFSYQHGSGTYPSIDGEFEYEVSASGSYLPWIYYRWNFQNLATDSKMGTQAYKDSAKWSKFLGMNYRTMADAVCADDKVEDVIQSMMITGIQAGAKSLSEREYLYRYFDFLHTNAEALGGTGRKSQMIKDKKFSMIFTFNGISKTTEVGVLTAPGKYMAPVVSGSTVTYRKQISATHYSQITVSGMFLRYNIAGKYGHVAGPSSKEMLVPLDIMVMKTVNLRRREDLIARSLHIMTNTYEEIKTKWYQSSWFKWVLIVVGIVITILSFGGLGPAVAALIAWITAGVTAIIISTLVAVVKMLLVQMAVKIFIDVAGLENSLIAAMVLVVASQFLPPGANQASMSQAMLAMGNNMVQQVGTGYGKELESIQKELQQFSANSKVKWEELQDRRAEEFGWSDGIKKDYLTLAPKIIFGEKPDFFFTRTVHTINTGPYLFVANHDYVEQALRLPEFIDTLGDPTQPFPRDTTV